MKHQLSSADRSTLNCVYAHRPLSIIAINYSIIVLRWNRAKRSGRKSRLLIYDSLFRHTHIVRKLTFLGVQKCGCVTIGYPRKKVIRARSLKNGLILYAYEDLELRNEVTVTFPIEGIFQNFFNFKLPHTHSITPATWHDINPAGYRAVAPTQTRPFSCIPP